MSNIDHVLARALIIYRREHPLMRASHLDSVLTVNSGSRRRTSCVVCRMETGSWCGKWPKTIRACYAEQSHKVTCIARRKLLGRAYQELAQELLDAGSLAPDAITL